MDNNELEWTLDQLENIRVERRRLRKRLIKFLRENVDRLPNNSWAKGNVLKKMYGNWFADFSDKRIIEYATMIGRLKT